jgi:SAM-dependent methyltransferase
VEAAVGDGTRLPFPNDGFDLVYCVAVLHHVADEDAVQRVLGEMVRVARPGGRVLVWDHNPRNPYWPVVMRKVPQDAGDERLVPEQEILAGLRRAGAEPELVRQLGLMPEFVPRSLIRAVATIERAVEATPGLRRLCAHNVILARKPAGGTTA